MKYTVTLQRRDDYSGSVEVEAEHEAAAMDQAQCLELGAIMWTLEYRDVQSVQANKERVP